MTTSLVSLLNSALVTQIEAEFPADAQLLPAEQTSILAGITQLATALSNAIQILMPPGTILPFGGSSSPGTGFLLCQGQPVSRTTYVNLFAAIGTTYGIGDGSTTFNVPNLQGAFLRGAGSQTVGGIAYSTTLGATQADEFQGHIHQYTFRAGSAGGGDQSSFCVSSDTLGQFTFYNAAGTSMASGASIIADTTNGAPRTGLETRPMNVGTNFIIAT